MRKDKVRLVYDTTDRDTLRPHYDFSKAVRGVTAARYYDRGTKVVVLEPDVATAFSSSAAVNKALRSLMRRARSRKPRPRRNARER